MNIIFAVGPYNSFCKDDCFSLPWGKIKEDLQYFKEVTTKKHNDNLNAVIMGYNTYISLNKMPLKDRINIVISNRNESDYISYSSSISTRNIYKSQFLFFKTLEESLDYCYSKNHTPFVIGGREILKRALLRSDIQNIYINKIYTNELIENYLTFDYIIPSYTDLVSHKTSRKDEYIIHFLTYSRNNSEEQYLNLIKNILSNGIARDDRTGVGTISTFGNFFKMDVSKSFPLLTTKRVFWKGVVEELLFFIRGETNSKLLEKKGVNIWKGNTSRDFLDKNNLNHLNEGELGPLYGYQWRNFGHKFDQIQYILNEIRNNPYSRRIIVTALNPLEYSNTVLLPCHYCFQFYVSSDLKSLSMLVNMRSCDVFLGLPFNIASYALLLYIVCKMVDKEPGELSFCLGDTHIYKSHIDAVKEQITRECRILPTLKVLVKRENISDYKMEDFLLEGYNPHPTIKAEMAV